MAELTLLALIPFFMYFVTANAELPLTMPAFRTYTGSFFLYLTFHLKTA